MELMDIDKKIKLVASRIINNPNKVVFNKDVLEKMEAFKKVLQKDLNIEAEKPKRFFSMKEIENTILKNRRSYFTNFTK
jgi:hypothetical protein